jgi:cytochrome c oxidase assembly protein subunit 15
LLGALLGLQILWVFVQSFGFREREPNLPWYCGGLAILIGLQGGVGALVVSTHLKPYVITLHMLLALLLLFCLQYLRKYCRDLDNFGINFKPDQQNLPYTKLLIGAGLLQVFLGTQVRENVDHLMRDAQTATAATVVEGLGWVFYVHRTFSLALLALAIYSLVRLYRHDLTGSGFKRGILFLFLLLCNVATGVVLNYFEFSPQMQAPHLFIGVLAMGVLFRQYLEQKGTLIG